MKRAILIVVAVVMLLALTGCSKDYSGTYGGMSDLGIPVTVELKKDGTATTNILGFPVSGSYIVEDFTLTLKVMVYGFSQRITGRITGDTIEFADVTLTKGVTSVDIESLYDNYR